MRVFNVRLAAILAASALVFGIGVYYLNGYQVRRHAHVILEAARNAQEAAEKAAKEKNARAEQDATAEAVRNWGLYVHLMPNDVGALEDYGLMLAKLSYDGNVVKSSRAFSGAVETLEHTVRLAPERKKARRELVKMYMFPQVRRYSDAKEHLQKFLLAESPKDPELLELLGQCETELSEYNLAMDNLRKAVEYGPDRFTAYVQAAGVLRDHLFHPQEADQWMEKLVEANPKSAKAHLLRGRYLLSLNVARLNDVAAEEASKALALAPDDTDVLGLAATCAMMKRQYDKARGYVSHGIKLHPDSVALYVILTDVELYAGDRDKAIAVLEQGVKATDRNPELVWRHVNLLIDAKKLPEAEQIIQDLRVADSSRAIPDYFLDYLAARIEFSQRHWLAALEGFEKIRPALVSLPKYAKQADLWIGQCYSQSGDHDMELQAYRRALSVDPSYAPAKAALTDALIRMGRYDEAKDQMRDLVYRGATNVNASIPLARMLFLEAIRRNSSERNWAPVERALDVADKYMPGSPDIVDLRAKVLMAQDRTADAENLLRKACEKNPQQAGLRVALASLLEQQKEWGKMEKLLAESEQTLGDGAALRVMQAGYLAQRYGKDAKARLRKLAENTGKFSEVDRVQLWIGLLDAATQAGDTEEADLYCRKIAESQPDNIQIRYVQFRRALLAGDQAAMARALDDVQRVAGQSAYWQWGKAILIGLQAKAKDKADREPMWEQALLHLAKAREMRDDWSRIPATTGQVYDELGKTDLALKNFLEALELGDGDQNVIRRALQLLLQTRQFAEADKLLRRLERQRLQFPRDLTQIAVEVALQRRDYDRALTMTRKIAAESKTYQDYIWLGQVLSLLGNHAKTEGRNPDAEKLAGEAETALRRAVELEPKLAATWIGLMRHYALTGETDKAQTAIRDAEAKIPAKDAPLALAQCYDITKMADPAEKKYEEALALMPQDIAVVRPVADFYVRNRKSAMAEPLLLKITDGTLKSETSDVAWARRQLAFIYAVRGGYRDLKKAEGLIEKNRDGAEATVSDLQMLARLYACDPSPVQRGEAIGMLENMIKSHSATADDRLSLARIYLAAGDWTKASDLLRRLIADTNNDPRYLVPYIEALLQHRETSDLEGYLNRLKKVTSNGFTAFSLQADLLLALKRPQEALELLATFVGRTDVQPKDHGERVHLVADKLAQLGRQLAQSDQNLLANEFAQRAETLFRSRIKEGAGQELPLAVFLASDGKVDEALDVLDQALDKSESFKFAQACAAVLQNISSANKKQSERLDQLVAKALGKVRQSISLQTVMADSYTRQARYAEAEALYRKILEKNPNDAIAMNNLALLLALQGVKLDEALTLANQAVDIIGPLGPVLDSRACVYIALHELDKALKDINESLADQETPARLFHQAQVFLLLEQTNSARTAIFKALQMGLNKDMLQPSEIPIFEKLKQLPQS